MDESQHATQHVADVTLQVLERKEQEPTAWKQLEVAVNLLAVQARPEIEKL